MPKLSRRSFCIVVFGNLFFTLNRGTRPPIHPCVSRVQFWIINGASLIVAALIGCEIILVHQLDNVGTLVEQAQVPLAQAQQNGPQIQALVQRTALGATRDPALRDLLAKYGITLKEKPAPSATSTDSTTTTTAPPPPGNVGAQVSSTSPVSASSATP